MPMLARKAQWMTEEAVAKVCKKVWVLLRLGTSKMRGPKTWKELESCLKQYRDRVEEAEEDASEWHRSYMELKLSEGSNEAIIKGWKETDTVYLQTLGLAKAVVELLGKECATEVGFREWHRKWKETQTDRREPTLIVRDPRLDRVIEILSEHDEVLAFHLKDLKKK